MRTARLPLTVGALAAILIGVLVALGAFRTPAPPALPPASAAIATHRQTPVPSAATSRVAAGTFENAILGYRIALPVGYRLVGTSINAGHPEHLGSESFRLTTVAEQQADCTSETGGGIASIIRGGPVDVSVTVNTRGLSAVQWATSSPYAALHTVEAVTVAGYEAARLIQQGKADTYVISANGRMYVVSHVNAPSSQRLADIASSFRALPPGPFPTAPPAQIARDAASELGRRLAQAFAAKDATAVAGLLTDCRIGASANVGGGSEGLSRSSAAFVAALRDRFAKGDLAVTVDPAIQVHAGTGQLFVRSDWTEPDRTVPIDLVLRELDGRWQWTGSTHHYPSLVGNGCIPYRSPWTASSCEAGR